MKNAWNNAWECEKYEKIDKQVVLFGSSMTYFLLLDTFWPRKTQGVNFDLFVRISHFNHSLVFAVQIMW